MKNTSARNKAGTRATPKTNARKNGWRGVVVPRNTSRDISADIQGRWLMLGDTDRHGKFTEYGGYVGDDLYSAEWRIDGDTVAFTQLANGVVRLQLKERYTIDDGMFYNHDSLFTGKAFIDGNQMAMEAADGQILYFRRVG